MARTITEKMGVREGMRAYLLKAPGEISDEISSDKLVVSSALKGKFDLIIAFFTSQKQMRAACPRLRSHLKQGGILWLCWPKGRGLHGDLTLKDVIAIGYDCDMVESKSVSVNAVWSALKFTFPRIGKTYENSYGSLPRHAREVSVSSHRK